MTPELVETVGSGRGGRHHRVLEAVGHLPLGLALGTLHRQTWFTRRFLCLRADLHALPAPTIAAIRTVMEPRGRDFDGFERELSRADGTDWLESFVRSRMLEAGIPTLYAACVGDGEPIYCQWLVRAKDWPLLDAHKPGRYAPLADDEVILENAFTFSRYRKLGTMSDGMGQLLRIAAEGGATSALTYVAEDNLASLKGCHRVGFELHRVRENTRRPWGRTSMFRPIDELAREAWRRAAA